MTLLTRLCRVSCASCQVTSIEEQAKAQLRSHVLHKLKNSSSEGNHSTSARTSKCSSFKCSLKICGRSSSKCRMSMQSWLWHNKAVLCLNPWVMVRLQSGLRCSAAASMVLLTLICTKTIHAAGASASPRMDKSGQGVGRSLRQLLARLVAYKCENQCWQC